MSTSSTKIEVLRAGPQTSVQDGGRPGYLSRGIPPSGAQDYRSLALASRLVGNAPPPPPLTGGNPGDAGFEFLLQGPKLVFHYDAVIAVGGGEFPIKIDGERVPGWQTHEIKAGQTLDIGMASEGLRGYLAVAGGVDVEPWLGSRATYTRGGRGGFEGRPLKEGDRVPMFATPESAGDLVGQRLAGPDVPDLDEACVLRCVLGPQNHLLTEESLEEFFRAEWKMTTESDRMGFRLNGPELEFKPRPEDVVAEAGELPSNIALDATPLGGVQLTSGPEAIVMGVEVPSMGLFAKPVTVISADQSRIAQIRPGQTLKFEPVEPDDAVRIGREQAEFVKQVAFERAQGGAA